MASPDTPKARQILDMNAFDGGAAGHADGLVARRLANAGAASVLFYREPIEMVAASGAWMEARDGTRYLDFYNNVPSVGHSHPHVVAAISRQIARLNTNTRYLNAETERYLERLKATMPADLSNVILCCTGSEANDLALRMVMKATGGTGFVVTETAYHGNTHLSIQVSPSSYKTGGPPDFVVSVPAPGADAYGDDVAGGFAAAVEGAIETLSGRGIPFAGLICDTIFSSDGVFAEPAGFLAGAVERVRGHGGLFIADEVQPGFGRTGTGMWGFQRHGVTPDVVTMGKPMGNGFPMAGVVATPELVSSFCEEFGYFNTFGGNPVAAAAGNAVLDVIEDEGLIANAGSVGAGLKSRLQALAATDPRILAVRGAGLFLGVDLGRDGAPDPGLASDLINGLRDRGMLIGAAGKYGHTLKVRPPLCLSADEAAMLVDGIADILAG
ncbi:MAG: aspartate aminotransferase family protein [Pseudomonadota bacterium]